MVMFFNVESVRLYLINNGYVYTLRKKRKRVGWDIAVYGSRYKQKRIGKIFISLVPHDRITEKVLTGYFSKSGLSSSPREWLKLARKLSGDELYLYHVMVINDKE